MNRQMKDSGIEWIGEIPETWNTDRLQWHLKEVKESNSPIRTEDILSLTIESGVIPYEDKGNQGNKAKENYEEYKLAFPDTLVVNSMNVIIGAVGISKHFGCVSPVYYVFSADGNTNLRYIYYLFTNVGFQKEMRKYAKGILEIRLRISASDMLRLQIPNPKKEEQKRIADYLDQQCAHIDAVIEKTKASIEEYKKLKQAVITQAVTKGIRGDRPMKDSGIEWIGEIPAEWDVLALKYLCSMQSGKNLTSEEIAPEGDFKVYGGNGVRGYYKDYNADGDYLLVGRQGALCGNVHHVNGKFWATEHAVITSITHLSDIKFLFYLLIGMNLNQYISSTAAQPGLAVSNILNIRTCLVPISEQEEIAFYLDEKCSEIDSLAEKKETLLAELETYKKSLIYEYVTGKKEVPQSCQ